jgi:hypothetical protein
MLATIFVNEVPLPFHVERSRNVTNTLTKLSTELGLADSQEHLNAIIFIFEDYRSLTL